MIFKFKQFFDNHIALRDRTTGFRIFVLLLILFHIIVLMVGIPMSNLLHISAR
jgi:hypothetical protein